MASRKTGIWMTIVTIIGFFAVALSSALGHYLLFLSLHGEPVDTSLLTQTQISAVSMLLNTIFKAALTASMGICFTQHLWYLLRERVMSLSTIEKLFIIRTNIIAFGDLRKIWEAPLLFFIALLIWDLGLATVYPPSALLVTIDAHTYIERHNMSVMNPPVPLGVDMIELTGANTYPTLGATFMQHGMTREGETKREELRFDYRGPFLALINIAQSTIISDQMFALPMHPGENSTYSLQFRAPNLRCNATHYEEKLSLLYTLGDWEYKDVKDYTDWPAFEYKPYWVPPEPFLTAQTFRSGWDSNRLIFSSERHEIGRFEAYRSLDNSTRWEAFTRTEKQVCKPISVLHDVNATFPHGIQNVQYETRDAKALMATNYTDGLGPSLSYPIEAQSVQDWYDELYTLLPIFNEWALLDALGTALNFSFYESTGSPLLKPGSSESGCERGETMLDGTVVYGCNKTEWDWEVFNKPKNDGEQYPLRSQLQRVTIKQCH
ncbi:hypothetical protein G6011_07988 [Alternaria panax]|uniref:Uncharacterized protein n=1 Tax=Alternaria panax TaxID=48097 RepID=A0AAD4I7D7_9PLEO|nr:hypothetical protein G6011_07988 [Alternaria panax]